MMNILLLNILLVLGLIALILSLVVYQIHKISWLTYHGRQVNALVTSIRHETGKTAWGLTRDNYYLTATWTNPRTGRTYTFWTWIINANPAFTKGSLVPVLIDPKHPEHYALDL